MIFYVQKYFSSNLQQSSAAKQPRKHGVGFQTPDSVASCRLRVRCRVESVVWGQGLCREKSLNPSPGLPGPDCWQLHGLQHYTAGRGRGRVSSNNPTCWQTCYHREGEGCLGKIPITHIHLPGLINFIIPNPSAMIESLRTNVQRPHSQISWLLLFICLPWAGVRR